MVEAKHEFIDDNPYIVYTSQDTIVYSDKADTSIDDVSGGGDYSIASVTIVNNASGNYTFVVPNIYEDEMYAFIDSSDIDSETPFDIVLYKGNIKGSIFYTDSEAKLVEVKSVDGDIEKVSASGASISGNGSITIGDVE